MLLVSEILTLWVNKILTLWIRKTILSYIVGKTDIIVGWLRDVLVFSICYFQPHTLWVRQISLWVGEETL